MRIRASNHKPNIYFPNYRSNIPKSSGLVAVTLLFHPVNGRTLEETIRVQCSHTRFNPEHGLIIIFYENLHRIEYVVMMIQSGAAL